MATDLLDHTIAFPSGLDARAIAELPLKGYLENVVVQLGDGRRFSLAFTDPERLSQDVEIELAEGRGYVAEIGLIVLPVVTIEAIQEAVKDLCQTRFFADFGPLE